MGNHISAKQKAKVVKIDGQIFKKKLPAKAADVLIDYPATYVLMESDSVKKFGIRAPRLRPEEELKPKKIYFLVDLPKFPEERQRRNRRVGSEVDMGMGYEWLMLNTGCEVGSGDGPVRVKIRVPRAQIRKLMEEGGDEADVAERIVNLYLQSKK